MDMNPWERRQKILEVLCLRRHDTYGNLAHEFNVSTGTIRRDIVVLTCSYPIETVQGGHGGVRVAEWFHLDRRSLNSAEISFLRIEHPTVKVEPLRHSDTAVTALHRFNGIGAGQHNNIPADGSPADVKFMSQIAGSLMPPEA